MDKIKKYIADFITFSRIPFSIAMLFFNALSPGFFGFYLAAGITDMIDGTVARALKSESEFGSLLDTLADFVFVIAAAVKLLPVMNITRGLWIGISAVAVIKIINIISGLVMYKKIVAPHSIGNKITGLLLFILPFTLTAIDLKYSGGAVCIVAAFAAIIEGHLIRKGKENELHKSNNG